MLGVLPDDVAAELLDGMAGYGACGFHCHKWEAGFRACYAAAGLAGAAAPSWPRSAPTPTCSRRRRPSPACAAAADGAAGRGGRPAHHRADATAWSPRRTSCGACSPSRSCCSAHPEWRGEVVHVALAYPSRQGLAEYLAYAADVEHTAERINHACGDRRTWTPIVLSVERRLGPLAGRADRFRRAAGQPGARRAQPGGQGGPAAQRAPTACSCCRAEAGAWEELALGGGGALGVNPFDVSGTADALHAALTMAADERARRAAALRAAVRGAHRGRLVGRPAGGRLSAERPARAARRRRRRRPASRSSATAPAAPAHRQVGRAATAARALGVDRGDPHRVERARRRAAARPARRRRAGRRCRRRRRPAAAAAARAMLVGQRAHHGSLVHVRAAGAARARAAPGAPARPCVRRLALGERHAPSPRARERGASAASRSGPWARRRRPAGAVAMASATTCVDHRGPGRRASGPRERALEPVEAGQRRRPAGAPSTSAQERGGAARDHRHQRERGGQLGQQRGHAGQRPRLARVVHDGRQRPVEVEEQRAARRVGGQRLQRRRQARRGVGRGSADVRWSRSSWSARSSPMTTTTSTPVAPVTGVAVVSGSTCGRLHADGGGDGRRRPAAVPPRSTRPTWLGGRRRRSASAWSSRRRR